MRQLTKDEVQGVVQTALRGPGKIIVTFMAKAKMGVSHLIGMEQTGRVQFANSDKVALELVSRGGDWKDGGNRTVRVVLTERFDADWFVGRMWRFLEHIEVMD